MPGELRYKKSLVRPTRFNVFGFFQTDGFFSKLILISSLSAILTGISYFLSAEEAFQMPVAQYLKLSATKLVAAKIIYLLAGLVIGFVKPVLVGVGGALLLWFFFRELGIKKLFLNVTIIFGLLLCVVDPLFKLPFQGMLHSNYVLSPLSLGVMIHRFSNNAFLLSVGSVASVITAIVFYSTYLQLCVISEKPKRYIFTILAALTIVGTIGYGIVRALQYGQLTL
ncbi:hypothetical protein A374_14470 [Fictibacillus macauensis ZFHKF-1]|uniref:Yip1 domain-containing protein n=1 Tax=Fictibacillus macauensis ZFHKF-1 TaxID=1196324 RepID=I8AFZ3_9BACL|nr:hypothetical protein [Fictibacillus macauensis]EIT84542.1 hypothetical protein A374_14470 [Fictibacillus macauensis ZFHKF-1]